MLSYQYLTMDDVLYLHSMQMERFGGAPGVRDMGIVQSALQRPQTGYYNDLIAEAAALWESLTMNHGFVDGNKRIGLKAMAVFLQINGIRLIAEPQETEDFILRHLSAGTFRFEALDEWLRAKTESI